MYQAEVLTDPEHNLIYFKKIWWRTRIETVTHVDKTNNYKCHKIRNNKIQILHFVC